jgi:hypothetical protein
LKYQEWFEKFFHVKSHSYGVTRTMLACVVTFLWTPGTFCMLGLYVNPDVLGLDDGNVLFMSPLFWEPHSVA